MGAIVSNPEAIKKVKSDIALVFDTDKPTTSIQANKYVVWRNKLYMTNRAISTSDSFVPGDNIREVTDGVGNDLYSNITNVNNRISNLVITVPPTQTTSDNNGIITTNVLSGHPLIKYAFGTYLLLPYANGGYWKLAVFDVDGTSLALKPNVTANLHLSYI